jgi:hypothetical protein
VNLPDFPHEGEDVIAWVMRVERMTFPEAVEYLAWLKREDEARDYGDDP